MPQGWGNAVTVDRILVEKVIQFFSTLSLAWKLVPAAGASPRSFPVGGPLWKVARTSGRRYEVRFGPVPALRELLAGCRHERLALRACPLSSAEIVRNMRSSKELGHDAAHP